MKTTSNLGLEPCTTLKSKALKMKKYQNSVNSKKISHTEEPSKITFPTEKDKFSKKLKGNSFRLNTSKAYGLRHSKESLTDLY